LQRSSLCLGGIDSIFVGPFMHNTTISKSDIRSNLSSPHAVLGSHSRLFRGSKGSSGVFLPGASQTIPRSGLFSKAARHRAIFPRISA
jgi:hypothetical protein